VQLIFVLDCVVSKIRNILGHGRIALKALFNRYLFNPVKLTELHTLAAAPTNALATGWVKGVRKNGIADRCKFGPYVPLATMRTSKDYVVGDS
jgi:hypothetical protein